MAKRFVDTEIWKDPWFQELSPVNKCLWKYLCDNCDNAGVWKINKSLAQFQIGAKIDWNVIPKLFCAKLHVLDQDKWLLIKFIDFQCGNLSKDCKPHKKIFELLDKHGLTYPINILSERVSNRVSDNFDTLHNRVQEEEEEKDKDKEEEEEEAKGMRRNNIPPTVEEIAAYCAERKNSVSARSFFDHYQARGWEFKKGQKMKDWQAAVRTWEKNSYPDQTQLVIPPSKPKQVNWKLPANYRD